MNLVFPLKEKFEKSSTKKDGCIRQDINDEVLINEKEYEKEKKSTAKSVGQRYIIAKGISWGK